MAIGDVSGARRLKMNTLGFGPTRCSHVHFVPKTFMFIFFGNHLAIGLAEIQFKHLPIVANLSVSSGKKAATSRSTD